MEGIASFSASHLLSLEQTKVCFQAIAEALGLAAVKAVVAISAIIAGGRLVESDIAPYRGLLLGLFFMTIIAQLLSERLIPFVALDVRRFVVRGFDLGLQNI